MNDFNYSFGLVCISMDMQESGYRFQTMTRKRFNELGRSVGWGILKGRIINNLMVTEKTIRHCADKGIAAYRLSSDLFPLITDPTLDLFEFKDVIEFQMGLALISKAVKETGVRISTHPDQWNSLASLTAGTIEQTIKELNFHGWLLDQCGAERSRRNPINLHVGLSGKDPDELKNIRYRFIENFKKLDDSVKTRLTLENDDKGLWTSENLYEHFRNSGIPLCFDEHHERVNPSKNVGLADAHFLFATTWPVSHKPLFHYSESRPNEKNVRAHADYPTELPIRPWCMGFVDVDWDVELKMKDRAIYRLKQMALLKEMSIPDDSVD